MSTISCQIRKQGHLSKTTAIVSSGLDKTGKTVSALVRIIIIKDQNTSNMFKPRSS